MATVTITLDIDEIAVITSLIDSEVDSNAHALKQPMDPEDVSGLTQTNQFLTALRAKIQGEA